MTSVAPAPALAHPTRLPSDLTTDSLRLALKQSRERILQWASSKRQHADQCANEHAQRVRQVQISLNAAAEQWRTLRLQTNVDSGGAAATAAAEIENEEYRDDQVGTGNNTAATTTTTTTTQEGELVRTMEQLQQDMVELRNTIRSKEVQIEDLTRIVGVRHETVRQAQEWKDSVLASRNAAISQLTNCLNKYQRLGLHFERRAYDQHHNDKDLTKSSDDAKEALQFWFTLLDANDPDRAFPFTLRCDEATDAYQVLDCDALLDSKIVQQLVMELNETDDMTTFIAQMRHAFLQALKSLPPAAL